MVHDNVFGPYRCYHKLRSCQWSVLVAKKVNIALQAQICKRGGGQCKFIFCQLMPDTHRDREIPFLNMGYSQNASHWPGKIVILQSQQS